jgi:ssDNA-binding Zn-finger/Zn-ribbon topoisomerase 1
MKNQGYGLPLICPACPEKGNYFGMLKVPGNKAIPCPNCGTSLIALRKHRRIPMADANKQTLP